MELIPMGAIPAYHARRKPDAIAVVHGEQKLSWAELARGAAARARGLQRLGVSTGDFVVFALWNGNPFVETAFAIWMAGGIPVPVSPKSPIPELTRILDLVKPKVIIGIDPLALPGWQVLPAEWTAAGESDTALEVEPAAYWKAICSGGSTGKPKVIVTHRPARADPTVYDVFDPAVNQQGQLGRVDGAIVNPGPLYHNGPFNLVFNNMFVGSKLIGLQRFDAENLLVETAKHKGELLYLVPTMMHRIWSLPPELRNRYDLSSVRGIIHMAAACPSWLKRHWIDWLGKERIYEVYGSTEGIGATLLSGAEWEKYPTSVGRFAGYTYSSKVRILDENRQDVAPGEVGELFFLPHGGQGSTYHYIGAEPRTEGEYESVGDLGRIDADGYLHLADRRTDMILRGGANIYPAEVESAIEEHPGVAAAAVIGLPHEDLGNTIHAIVELWPTSRGQVGIEDLNNFIRGRLTTYKLPASWEFVETPLRDEAGKIRRAALRAERVPA